MRLHCISVYYFPLLLWIYFTIDASEATIDPECIVHQRDEEFNATILTIPPISVGHEVAIKIKDRSNDQGIELEFKQITTEWTYLDWTHKGISTKYNTESTKKTFEVTNEGQASGNCKSGKFTWKITTNKNRAKLYNIDKLQILKIKVIRNSEVSFLDDGTSFYMCHDPMHENYVIIKEGEKCLEGTDSKELLKPSSDYTLQFLTHTREVANISAIARDTFAIRGKSLVYTIVFDPTPAVENNEEPLGYITEKVTSNLGDSPTFASTGISSDVTCTSENAQEIQEGCPQLALGGHGNSNVSIIVLSVLVAILLIALIALLIFKKSQTGDKLHPMPESHTNGNSAEAGKGSNNYNAMEERKENSGAEKAKFNRISQMPTALEEENDIYDSAENVLDRKV